MGRVRAVVLLGALIAVVPGRSSAQDNFDLDAPEAAPAPPEAPPPVRKTPIEEAREHMERGQALYGAQRYIEAAEEFLRAYEAQPYSAFLYNAGVAYEKVDDPRRAADYFTRFLQAEPRASNASQLQARIEKLRQGQRAAVAERESFKSLLNVTSTPSDAEVVVKSQAGEVLYRGSGERFTQTLDPGGYVVEVTHPRYQTISAPINVAPAVVNVVIAEMSQGQFLGYLRVQSDVPGAAVFVDERGPGSLGRTPFQNAIKVGKHHVWIEKPGYKSIERDVTVGVGEDPLVKVELERVDFGRIRVVSNDPNAEVFIDGSSIGRAPVEKDVPHGEHTVKVRAEGMKTFQQDVVVQRGQATPLRVRLRPKVGRTGAWVTGGVAAGVLGASIAVAVVGKGLQDDLAKDRKAGTLRSDDDRADRGRFMWIGADVGFGVAAGLAGLATWYFLRDPLPDSEGRVLEPRDWALNVSPNRVDASYRVSF